jgi:hypothetical protein
MEEREVRRRVTWVVGLLLAAAFVATLAWSIARDADDGEASDALAGTVDSDDRYDDPIVVAPTLPPEVVEPAPERMTLTVHTDGCGVIRSEAPPGMSRLNWLVKDADGFEVLQRNALGEDRYRYFEPGRYTVVLQTLGGTGYIEISNTVEITC